jgi:hypothetical protein
MTTETTVELERELVRDVDQLGDRLVDAKFCGELYRALTNNIWRKDGGPDGHVSLSWSRAEEIVNELRERRGEEPMELAQTGDEGEISETAGTELDRLGWHATALNTGRHDDQHASKPESPPPKGTGEQQSPVDDSRAWERQAHEEADHQESADSGAGPTHGTGAGGGWTQPGKA